MQWASFGDFLAMGGYWPYVWGSYAVAAIGLLVEVAALRRRRRAAGREVKQ